MALAERVKQGGRGLWQGLVEERVAQKDQWRHQPPASACGMGGKPGGETEQRRLWLSLFILVDNGRSRGHFLGMVIDPKDGLLCIYEYKRSATISLGSVTLLRRRFTSYS